MHATVRRLQVNPGAATAVAALIEAEYVPLMSGVAGFVSYSLVDLGGDQVSSLGVFESPEAAAQANEIAKEWVGRRLGPLIASPLEAAEGAVLVHTRAGT